MFGIGGSEIIVILVLALIFLGPDKLPEAAKQISKGIRDLKRHGRVLQQTIEDDEHIGGAIRDLKSALNPNEITNMIANAGKPGVKKKKKRKLPNPVAAGAVAGAAAGAAALAAGEIAGANANGAAPATAVAVATTDASGHTEVAVAAVAAATDDAGVTTTAAITATSEPTAEAALADAAPEKPPITLPRAAGELDHDGPTAAETDAADAAELAAMIRPATGTIAKSTLAAVKPEPEHG